MNIVDSIKGILSSFLLLAFLLSVVGLYYSFTSYFDPFGFCFIGIDGDVVRGEESTIKQALKRIKTESPSDYKTVCRSVNEIKEKYCMEPDLPLRAGDKPGCYIRGSRVIFVIPQKQKTEKVIEERIETITKYASRSETFWRAKSL